MAKLFGGLKKVFGAFADNEEAFLDRRGEKFEGIMRLDDRAAFDRELKKLHSFVEKGKYEGYFAKVISDYLEYNELRESDFLSDGESLYLFIRRVQLGLDLGETELLWSLREHSVHTHATFALQNLGNNELLTAIKGNTALWKRQYRGILAELVSLSEEDTSCREADAYFRTKQLKSLLEEVRDGKNEEPRSLVFDFLDEVAKSATAKQIKKLEDKQAKLSQERATLQARLDVATDSTVQQQLEAEIQQITAAIRRVLADIKTLQSGSSLPEVDPAIQQELETRRKALENVRIAIDEQKTLLLSTRDATKKAQYKALKDKLEEDEWQLVCEIEILENGQMVPASMPNPVPIQTGTPLPAPIQMPTGGTNSAQQAPGTTAPKFIPGAAPTGTAN